MLQLPELGTAERCHASPKTRQPPPECPNWQWRAGPHHPQTHCPHATHLPHPRHSPPPPRSLSLASTRISHS